MASPPSKTVVKKSLKGGELRTAMQPKDRPPALSEPKSYTTVVTADLFTEIDIFTLFEVVAIDDFVIGVNLNNRTRGFIKDTGSFYNQISLVLSQDGRDLNTKIFVNGVLHISGAREDLVTERRAIARLAELLNGMRGWYQCQVRQENGMIVGVDNDFLYGYSDYMSREVDRKFYERKGLVRNVVRTDRFTGKTHVERVMTIRNKPIVLMNGCHLIYDRGNKYLATILDRLCTPIGEQRLVLMNNRKNTPQSSGTVLMEDGRLFNERSHKVIGRYERVIRMTPAVVPVKKTMTIAYKVAKQHIDADKIRIACRNNNNRFEIAMGGTARRPAFYVDRRALERVFEGYGIKSASEPEKYFLLM